MKLRMPEIPPANLLAALGSYNLLPAIVFLPTRRSCDEAASEAALSRRGLTDNSREPRRDFIRTRNASRNCSVPDPTILKASSAQPTRRSLICSTHSRVLRRSAQLPNEASLIEIFCREFTNWKDNAKKTKREFAERSRVHRSICRSNRFSDLSGWRARVRVFSKALPRRGARCASVG